MCLLAYHSMSNAFFRDLPVSSFVFHSSLLTVNSVNLVIACDGFFCIMQIVPSKLFVFFVVATLITEVLFKQLLTHIAVQRVEHSWRRREMDTSVSDDIWSARHHHIFHGGYFEYRHTFRTVLDSYCCVTGWTSQTKNHNGYFAECVGSSIIICKKSQQTNILKN